jgi:tellurite resistance protein
MIPEESVAYAIATWARFDDSVSGELLRALCSAFALVAAADGELSRAEVDRFVGVLRSKADVFSAVDFDEIEAAFRDLAEAIVADPEDGKRLALGHLTQIKEDPPEQRELVRAGAEIAAAADGRARPAEARALREIRQALGLEG